MKDNLILLNTTQAAEYIGMGEMHLKQLAREGKIVAHKEVVRDGVQTLGWKWSTVELDKYKATARQGVGKRVDGRNKYTFHATPEEFKTIQDFMKSQKFLDPTRANKPKK